MNANNGDDGLTVWNSLPKDIWDPKIVGHSFRLSLKTSLFSHTSMLSTSDIGYENVI